MTDPRTLSRFRAEAHALADDDRAADHLNILHVSEVATWQATVDDMIRAINALESEAQAAEAEIISRQAHIARQHAAMTDASREEAQLDEEIRLQRHVIQSLDLVHA